ncbi:MAG: methyltransferase domain-containing protein [Planctomycetes bacterium]|nr:methyltransferase domain-containing protein [Planctomycetota bacterium]
MRRLAEAIASLAEGRCLELGGGTGAVAERVADRRTFVHSDIAPAMCRTARTKLSCFRTCVDAEAIPFADGSFDTVLSAEMIYYLRDPQRFLHEAYRVLRPGGRLVLSTTNPLMRWMDRGRAWLRGCGVRGMFFDDGSPAFISLRRLRAMLAAAGLTLERAHSIVPLPFESMDALNRRLECTPIGRVGLFMIVTARKPARRGRRSKKDLATGGPHGDESYRYDGLPDSTPPTPRWWCAQLELLTYRSRPSNLHVQVNPT